jgi:glycosyltransferase involved in cell wall biosynthesis
LRLLFVLPEFYPYTSGGIATFYQNLLPALSAQGCDVEVIHGSATHHGKKTRDYKGVKVHDMDTELFLRYRGLFSKFEVYPQIRANLAAAWAMYEQAKGYGQFDFIEFTDYGWGYIPWVLEGHKNLAVAFHASIGEITYYDPVPGKEFEEDLTRIIEVATLSQVDKLITHGSIARTSWQQRLHKTIREQLPAFALNGVKLKETGRQDYGLVVGRIQYWKGPTILCEAMMQLEEPPRIYWLGRNMPYKNGMMEDHLAGKYPEVWGRSVLPLPQADKQKTSEYQAGALFVIVPSIWDVFNLTCIEAMAFGKIVICSDGAGASSIVKDQVNGFVFKNDDASDLARVIKKVLALSERERKQIAENAKATILQELDPSKIASERMEWYREPSAVHPAAGEDWIAGWLRPSETENDLDMTLNNLSLKKLIHHTARRIFKKLRK